MMYGRYSVVLKSLLDDEHAKAQIHKALSTYPLYEKKSKEEYIPSIVPTREQLNEKILNAYKYREIAFETVGRFIDELEIAMKEIMPYYNQRFFALDQDYNILYNADYTREITREREDESNNNVSGSNQSKTTSENSTSSTSNDTSSNTTTGTGNSTTNNQNTENSKGVKSDTPQGQLDIGSKGIDTLEYGSEAEWHETQGNSKATTSEENTATSNSTAEGSASSSGNSEVNATGSNEIEENGTRSEDEHTLERVLGNYGMVSSQGLVRQYMELISNVEQAIINDRRIKELFMIVY